MITQDFDILYSVKDVVRGTPEFRYVSTAH